MLRVAPKGDLSAAVPIRPEEDRLLRAAFGRYGGQAQVRAEAAAVVAHYQQLRGGQWFLCGCRPTAERPPALVPVSQSHIRRHEDARWPVHCDSCDFHRDPDEQRMITGSYAVPALGKPMRLVRALGAETMPPPERRLEASSQHARRPGLARLLLRLTTAAGLQAMGPDWPPSPLVDQIKALWAAAKSIEIDAGVPLPAFFCTSPARLGELVARIEAVPTQRFPHTRPHGVLIVRARAIGAGMVQPVSGEAIRVRGRLAVFGERAGDDRDTPNERNARAPYLVACVVGRALASESVGVLSAYAHPCASGTHLMLVDSDRERQTLQQLRGLQAWLRSERDLPVAIGKPMFDIGPDAPGEADPRPPCMPDFVVKAARADQPVTTAIAETMGFDSEDYRTRKQRMHPLMSAALGGACVIAHQFHEPADRPQEWRDRRFWQAMRRTLMYEARRGGG